MKGLWTPFGEFGRYTREFGKALKGGIFLDPPFTVVTLFFFEGIPKEFSIKPRIKMVPHYPRLGEGGPPRRSNRGDPGSGGSSGDGS